MRRIKRIVIAGVGGIGYWLLWCLCRDLAGTGIVIEAYDPDNFKDGSGHRRLPLVSNPEIKKVNLLTMQIRNIMGDMLHRAYASYLTPEDFKIGDWTETLVIDATDAPRDLRDLLWTTAKEVGAKIIRASYEGRTETAGGLALVASTLPFQKTGDNGGDYNSTPSQSLSFMAAGLAGEMIQEMLRSGKIRDIQIDIPVSPPEEIEEEIIETPIYYCIYPTCATEVFAEDQRCSNHTIDEDEMDEMEEPF